MNTAKLRMTAALGAAVFALTATLPAFARDSYVHDEAGMFSDATVSSLNQQIGDFAQQTGKEVVVDTVPSLSGATVQDAAERAFAQLQVNGVLIFLAKAERADLVVGDKASHAFFPTGSFASIHDAMRGYFRSGDFDGGIKTGVSLIINGYRSHERSAAGAGAPGYAAPRSLPSTVAQSTGGFHMGSFFWLLIILLAGFLIIRALFRAMSGPRMLPPGGPGYGPGYGSGMGGGGYGYGGGGGGGFFSGLLGGLGGAWLGNELFGNHGGNTIVQDPNAANIAGGGIGGADASGWQSDAGQADMGNAGGGDWGGGGGFDAGGGGGGGGFDSGGGGGDSGGGW